MINLTGILTHVGQQEYWSGRHTSSDVHIAAHLIRGQCIMGASLYFLRHSVRLSVLNKNTVIEGVKQTQAYTISRCSVVVSD
jgi:hypothetical protein